MTTFTVAYTKHTRQLIKLRINRNRPECSKLAPSPSETIFVVAGVALAAGAAGAAAAVGVLFDNFVFDVNPLI
jgi:hypothetical protein